MADIVGDLVRITVATTYPTEPQVQENNITFKCSISGGTDTRTALGANVFALYTGGYSIIQSSGCNIYGWKAAYLNRAPAPSALTGGTSTPGGAGSNWLPTQLRPLLRWGTGFAGRKYRGRLYLPTPSSTGITTGGVPSGAVVTQMANLGTGLVAPFSSAGSTWIPVIAHRPTGGGAWDSTPITGYTAVSVFATQRKSGILGRPNPGPPW